MRRVASIGLGRAVVAQVSRSRRLGARVASRSGSRVLILASPAAVFVAADWLWRGERLSKLDAYHLSTYGAAMMESVVLWGLLIYAASSRGGRAKGLSAVLFIALFTLAFGGQHYFFEQHNAYLNVDVSIFATNFVDSVFNQLFADLGNYLRAKLPPLLGALLLLALARRFLRPRRTRARIAQAIAPLFALATFFIPVQHRHQQAATPDVLYMNAVGGLIRTQLGLTEESRKLRPRTRSSLPVPPLTPEVTTPRNVLFLILESVRADAVCIEYDPDCRRTPYTNRLLPRRYPLKELRSMASSTAISLAVLWSGLGPHADRETLHTWPLIFDYARAGGHDTAYWTSQSMLFGNAWLWVKHLGVSRFVSATELDPTSDIDLGAPEHLLAERVNREIGELREPFLAVVQFSNVHYPYHVEADGPAPFQPASTSKAPEDNAHFFNYYLNAVHQQDRHVAQIVEHLRQTEIGSRTAIVYTSDHGEAFREHHQMGHTFSVFDEEIHVPGFIDLPPGLVPPERERNLRKKADAYTFHVDLAPTVLEILGLHGVPELDPYTERMLGQSLFDPEPNRAALPLTNCAEVWSCAFENWGYMKGNMKLAARAWDTAFGCYDLDRDPFEVNDLGAAACGELEALALRTFGRLPGR